MSQPAHKIRIGALQVTIWRNHGEKGNWYSVIPSRGYKQGDDAWKETDSLGFDDLLRWPSCSTWPTPGSCTSNRPTPKARKESAQAAA